MGRGRGALTINQARPVPSSPNQNKTSLKSWLSIWYLVLSSTHMVHFSMWGVQCSNHSLLVRTNQIQAVRFSSAQSVTLASARKTTVTMQSYLPS